MVPVMSQSTSSTSSFSGGRVIGEYSVGKQIGSGSFSVVWHARHGIHGTQFAIKEINLSRLNKKLQDSLLSEIFILKQINHPNIVHLHDIIEVPGKIHLVLEYCRGGDLFSYIQRHGRVPEATAKHFMQQLATGLKVLRENNLIHRDLKPQNLLLSTNDCNAVLKIADFGFARSLQPRGLAETLCGSPLYMAPEIMQLQKYDAKADLWSVGIILYQFVTGKTPFNGINQIQLLQNIIKAIELRFPKDINLSSDCMDLCQKLLRRNPVERLTFDEFFNHPFLCHKQLDDPPRREESLRRLGVGPLFEKNLANMDEISPDDCLPFLLDDDSSGPDGSPSLHGRRTFMKSTHGFSADPNREEASSNIRSIDHSPTHGSVGKKIPTSVFRTDGSRTSGINAESSSVHIEQRPLSSHSKALDSMEFSDQDYVLVSGPSLDIPSSSATMSKPSASGGKSDFLLPVSLSNNSRSSAPMPIAGPSARTIFCTGSLESQSSVPSGTSQGSMDTTDALEQPSTDSIARVNSLRQHAATIKQLVNEMVEAGRHLDAFSIQLVILAIWKQALHICHTQAVSDMEGSPQDNMKTKGSINKMNTSPDFLDPLGLVSSRVLEDVATEIKGDFFREVAHAEDLSNFVESGAGAEMPDAMETIYQSALALGRHGAGPVEFFKVASFAKFLNLISQIDLYKSLKRVDELMGDMESAASSYSKAVRLLIFLLIEAPSLILNPPFSLTNSDRFRLRNYINILNDRQGISRSQRMALLKPEAEERQCPP